MIYWYYGGINREKRICKFKHLEIRDATGRNLKSFRFLKDLWYMIFPTPVRSFKNSYFFYLQFSTIWRVLHYKSLVIVLSDMIASAFIYNEYLQFRRIKIEGKSSKATRTVLRESCHLWLSLQYSRGDRENKKFFGLHQYWESKEFQKFQETFKEVKGVQKKTNQVHSWQVGGRTLTSSLKPKWTFFAKNFLGFAFSYYPHHY